MKSGLRNIFLSSLILLSTTFGYSTNKSKIDINILQKKTTSQTLEDQSLELIYLADSLFERGNYLGSKKCLDSAKVLFAKNKNRDLPTDYFILKNALCNEVRMMQPWVYFAYFRRDCLGEMD